MIAYHPDPAINAEILRDVIAAEKLDIEAGFEPRRWMCTCGASHSRGYFPHGVIGSHRCLKCGYVGFDGVMWDPETEDPPNA